MEAYIPICLFWGSMCYKMHDLAGTTEERGAPEWKAIGLSWVVLTDQSPVPIYTHSITAVSPETESGFVTDLWWTSKLDFHCIFLGHTKKVANEPVTELHLLEGHSKIESPN